MLFVRLTGLDSIGEKPDFRRRRARREMLPVGENSA